MKRHEWIEYLAAATLIGLLTAGCSDLRRLAKNDPRVDVHLPAKSSQQTPRPTDTLTQAPKVIAFKKDDGTELFFASIDTDSVTGEKLMSVAIDEVVISAGSRRNLVERNGKITVDYVVTVPEELLSNNWQLAIDPRLGKGPDTLSLQPLVYSGDRFRSMQQREYERYDAYLSTIVDSTELFDRFGNKRAYQRYLDYIAREHARYSEIDSRLSQLAPEEAAADRTVGWLTRGEYSKRYNLLRNYVKATDRDVRRNATNEIDSTAKFSYLDDYLQPRYRYGNVEVIPGGEVYTRIQGDYNAAEGRDREAYIRALATRPELVRRSVNRATRDDLPELVLERLRYTELNTPRAQQLLRRVNDSTFRAEYDNCRDYTSRRLTDLASTDTTLVQRKMLDMSQVKRNRQRIDEKESTYQRLVQHPYFANARLDTIIHRPDGKIDYYCSDEVQADENTSKLYLFLAGSVEDRNSNRHNLTRSDTLTYNVASMTTFLDEQTRYMQRIILRDAEANARFFFTFPASKSELNDRLPENREQIVAVRNLVRDLMTDPIYIIDSITLRATASPEGQWSINNRIARERAEAIRQVLISEFRPLYDSLHISGSYTLDNEGKEVLVGADNSIPDLAHLMRTQWLAEDWNEVNQLVQADTVFTAQEKESVAETIRRIDDPDSREWRIRSRFPKLYERLRNVIYPQLRAVDFRFNLHRRGMQQDTVYTTEVDSNYMYAIELLKKRRYDDALSILRPYEDRNTALAYMSLGYDEAAYRILKAQGGVDQNADMQYMLAILAARLNDEEQAVKYFLRAVELRENLKFRGNLDPEISRLIRKYGMFREEFE